MKTKKFENNISTLKRLEQLIVTCEGHVVRTGNDLKERAEHTPYDVYKVFSDGNSEVIVDIEKHQPGDIITLPFCEWHDKIYGRSGGGRNFIARGQLHAIYLSGPDITHYFMVDVENDKRS